MADMLYGSADDIVRKIVDGIALYDGAEIRTMWGIYDILVREDGSVSLSAEEDDGEYEAEGRMSCCINQDVIVLSIYDEEMDVYTDVGVYAGDGMTVDYLKEVRGKLRSVKKCVVSAGEEWCVDVYERGRVRCI